jgi:uncharacterized protein involved in cysteine biosynthesis
VKLAVTKSEDSKRPRPLDLVQKVPWSDIRRQMVTSLSVAFGALIGFMWQSVVQQAFVVAGIITSTGIQNWFAWLGYAIGAVVVTFIAVIMILLIARGQAKAQQKQA